MAMDASAYTSMNPQKGRRLLAETKCESGGPSLSDHGKHVVWIDFTEPRALCVYDVAASKLRRVTLPEDFQDPWAAISRDDKFVCCRSGPRAALYDRRPSAPEPFIQPPHPLRHRRPWTTSTFPREALPPPPAREAQHRSHRCVSVCPEDRGGVQRRGMWGVLHGVACALRPDR
jgi:hypothetical protein